MAQTLVFNLVGTDHLSVVLNNAGDAAARLHRRLDDTSSGGGSALARLGTTALGVTGTLAGIGAAAGTALPAVAGMAAALAEVAPAAGVAATGMLALTSAQAALKIGMIGVEDAVTAALDPSKAEEFDEALKRLSPNARAFALSLKEAQPALDRIRRAVQDRLFEGLDTSLARTARVTLPALRSSLFSSAESLNSMGRGVLRAARDLGESGVLGDAVRSANRGLRNLTGVPALIVTGLGQIAAAAGPSFERLTSAAQRVAGGLSDRLTGSFESGALQDAIEGAVDLLGDLAEVVGNVGGVLGSIFSAAQVSGGGFIGTLQEITGALDRAFASPRVQSALTSLFETMGALAAEAGPLLADAISTVAPVLSTLGPPVQRLIGALGDGLEPIIDALGPVLLGAADAVGVLVDAVAPVLPVVGEVIAQLGPILTPIINSLGDYIRQAAPLWQQWIGVLASAVMPILQQLPRSLRPILDSFGELTRVALPIAQRLLTELSPSIEQIGVNFAELLIALTPLISAWLRFVAVGLEKATPVINAVISGVGRLARLMTGDFAAGITGVVMPAARAIARLLRGDFSGALDAARQAVVGLVRYVVARFLLLPRLAWQALSGLAGRLWDRMTDAGGRLVSAARSKVGETAGLIGSLPRRVWSGLATLGSKLWDRMTDAGRRLVRAARDKIGDAVDAVKKLPSKAKSALGDLGGVLVEAGKDIIRGFIDGVQDMIPDLKDVFGGITDLIPDVKGPPAKDRKLLYRSGRLIIEGFIDGIGASTPKLQEHLRRLTDAIPKEAERQLDDRLRASTKRLRELVRERQKVIEEIQRAREFAGEVRGTTRASAALSTIEAPEGKKLTARRIQLGLQGRLNRIKQFHHAVKRLGERGLHEGLLRQVLEMGPEEGYEYAKALLAADPRTLRRINRLQGDINQSAAKLGRMGADQLYDAGKQAGNGLLAGLKAQKKRIEDLMLDIAKGMQKAIRKALGIKSPSAVMAAVGRHTTDGLATGITGRLPVLQRAMRQVSDTVAAGVSARPGIGVPAAGLGASQSAPAPVTITVNGAMDPAAVAQQIQKMLLGLKRNYGVNVQLGVG